MRAVASFVLLATLLVVGSHATAEALQSLENERPDQRRILSQTASGYIKKPTLFVTASGSNAESTIRSAITLANSKSTTVQVTLKSDITLSSGFPPIGFASGILLKGDCANGRSKACVIDGNRKFRVFSGNFACGISLENLVVQHALNGVHVGGCQFAARRVTFQYNIADKGTSGGAVYNSRDSSPTTGSPLQFTTCFFLNNTALGNGGAINVGRDPVGGPDVKIAKCTFSKNSAGGSGGAIYSEGSEIYLRDSTFSQNTAARGGGAILTTSPSLTSIGTRFSSNAVVTGRGGAISIQASKASVQFCRSNFRRNRAPVFPVSNDLNGGTSDGTVTVCGSTGPRRIRKTAALKEMQSCSGCTGCPNDCNGRGTCALDGDLNPYCKCQNQYDPATACTACKIGYTLESRCAACASGFFPGQKGRCSVCGGMDKIQDLVGELSNLNNATQAASPKRCQQMCQRAQARPNQYKNYCNLWAFVENSYKVPSCRGSCLLFNDQSECGVRNVTRDARRNVVYQFMEPSFLNCD
ncbi:hypothetical protein CLOM_g7894 [Closterium sp. NIES-68]|nr:hypothetical protein CLOM_g7894 [Closterium sp. NIES-68]GJP58226.1 hypothetical protein CLOP_g22695 [Closterium sp. NIES-67]